MTDIGYAARRAANEVRDTVERAAHRASPFVEKFACLGYAAKGVVYVLIGLLAVLAAAGTGSGDTTGARGAFHTIMHQPFGLVLLGIVALGLGCYAMWQFIRAVEDPENEGSDGKAIAKRIGYFISGIIHAALVVYAAHLISGSAASGGGDDASAQSWSATLMSYPAGRWMLGLIGLGVAIYGIKHLFDAYRAKLDRHLVLERMRSDDARRWTRWISRFGIAARGIVFLLIGLFLMVAAYRTDPSEARGLGGALRALQQQPFGPWLLGAVALGLIAYGVYQFVCARYRRIETE